MRSFLLGLSHSLFDPKWLKAQSLFFARSLRFFLVISAVVSIVFVLPAIIRLPGALRQAERRFVANIPEFTATVTNGTLSVAGIPEFYYGDADEFGLIIDTRASSTLASLRGQADSDWLAGAALTREQFEVFNAETNQDEVYTWKEFGDWSLSKGQVVGYITHLNNSVWFKTLLSIALIILGFVGFVLVRLISLLVITGVAIALSRAAKKTITFKQIYSLGLLTIVVPIIVTELIGLLPITIPYLFSVTWLAWILAVVFNKEEKGVVTGNN